MTGFKITYKIERILSIFSLIYYRHVQYAAGFLKEVLCAHSYLSFC